jgi:hypothetical protein
MQPIGEHYPDQLRYGGTPYYPMELLNGLVVPKPNRQAPSCDVDETGRQFRRFVNASGAQDVQIYNGLRNRIASGYRLIPHAGYLNVIMPQIPGQTRGNYGGFHKRGPSPYNIEDLFQYGPGSQPAHPGGPGKIAGPTYFNPMTG